jgi:hypothetical protein
MKDTNGILRVHLLAMVTFVIVGCSQQPKPTPQAAAQPGAPYGIPLRVIRVLDNYDSVGSQNNKGCRLTNDQIMDYLAQAESFYDRSCHVELLWNGSIVDLCWDLNDMNWAGCSARNGRTVDWLWLRELQYAYGYEYTPYLLNIFFHGNPKVKTYPESTCGNSTINGNTVDPADEAWYPGTQTTVWKHILINDRGGVSGQGAWVSADGVVEHELGHWFLRQKSWQGGRYDDYEHCWPCNLLMRAHPPHPGLFADGLSPGLCERCEIWAQASNWNYP